MIIVNYKFPGRRRRIVFTRPHIVIYYNSRILYEYKKTIQRQIEASHSILLCPTSIRRPCATILTISNNNVIHSSVGGRVHGHETACDVEKYIVAPVFTTCRISEIITIGIWSTKSMVKYGMSTVIVLYQ